MKLSDQDRAMIDGEHGAAKQIAMNGLVQLGEAFDAEDLVDIGYAHVHAGMAMYLGDVEARMKPGRSKDGSKPWLQVDRAILLGAGKRHHYDTTRSTREGDREDGKESDKQDQRDDKPDVQQERQQRDCGQRRPETGEP